MTKWIKRIGISAAHGFEYYNIAVYSAIQTYSGLCSMGLWTLRGYDSIDFLPSYSIKPLPSPSSENEPSTRSQVRYQMQAIQVDIYGHSDEECECSNEWIKRIESLTELSILLDGLEWKWLEKNIFWSIDTLK